MIYKFKHDTADTPNSLMLDIKISNRHGIKIKSRGEIDTGAYRTCIPNSIIEQLRVDPTDVKMIKVANGSKELCGIYTVNIHIGDTNFKNCKVVGLPAEFLLIGRDLINLWNLEINGETKTFTIEPWSTDIRNSYINSN